MLERIRMKLTRRWAYRRKYTEKWFGEIGPRVSKLVQDTKSKSGQFEPTWCGAGEFQISVGITPIVVVDLYGRSCSCRRWELTGILCMHVVSVIYDNNEEPEDYIHEAYLKNTYVNTYKHPGRPKKLRIKELGEVPMSNGRIGHFLKRITCTSRGEEGHNKKTCERRKELKQKLGKKVVTQETCLPPINDEDETNWWAAVSQASNVIVGESSQTKLPVKRGLKPQQATKHGTQHDPVNLQYRPPRFPVPDDSVNIISTYNDVTRNM
ncbi:Zinc finger, PMZ-type [Parasponia andersonii]|uniref:Zinc finger, PMZ-type n=1 Tax=Parasponia andersonii TaxID=3476 RepID=A0A2P5B7H9_PARAD|nr:Zinc finger, PMZ-type [Parasponia andersonii]